MTQEIDATSTIIFVFSLIAIVFWYRQRVRAEGPEIAVGPVETPGRWLPYVRRLLPNQSETRHCFWGRFSRCRKQQELRCLWCAPAGHFPQFP